MEQNNLDTIQLTDSQKNVLKQIIDFVNHPTDRIFILKGYAGTGKTTLMRFLIKQLEAEERNYRLLASTGRAAKILSNLSGKTGGATTIHSMVYSFDGLNKEYDENEEPSIDKDGQLFLVFEATKLDEETTPETIYIVDEASMVSDVETQVVTQAKFGDGRLLKALLEYDNRPKSKFIFVGDPCQLPPIEEHYSPALTPDYFSNRFGMNAQEAQLTEIMRQGDKSGIVYASKLIRGLYNQAPENNLGYGAQRLWGHLPFRQYKDILLHATMEQMVNDYVAKIQSSGLNSAICICRSNKACGDLSATVRSKLGMPANTIVKGDLLMVIQNNMLTGLMNGDMVVVEEVSQKVTRRAQLSFRQMRVKELFTGNSHTTFVIEEIVNQSRLNLDGMQQHALFVDFIIRMKEKGITSKKTKKAFYTAMQNDPYLNALRCTYGYAVTCHKAQGGEWEDVYVHVPRNITMNPTKATYQWIYTAMTRAQNALHMVDDFFYR